MNNKETLAEKIAIFGIAGVFIALVVVGVYALLGYGCAVVAGWLGYKALAWWQYSVIVALVGVVLKPIFSGKRD